MKNFGKLLLERLATTDIWVNEICKYWRPVSARLDRPSGVLEFLPSECFFDPQSVHVGFALNQYLFLSKITQTYNATLWLCFDAVENDLCCAKAYHIAASTRERGIRFNKDNMDIVTMFDKAVDEMLYHCSLQHISGVSRVKEILVNLDNEIIYFIMVYYPAQLMYYNVNTCCYSGSNQTTDTKNIAFSGNQSSIKVYKEDAAKFILKQLVKTVRQLLSAGIVHKDIKPENILLTKLDESLFQTVTINKRGQIDDRGCIVETEDYRCPCKPLNEGELNNIKSNLKRVTQLQSYKQCLSHTTGIEDLALSDNFPYDPFIFCDFEWCLWESSDLVCDFELGISKTVPFNRIGNSAYSHAVNLVKEINQRKIHVLDYFINRDLKIPYTPHPNFLKNKVRAAPAKGNHNDNHDQLVVLIDFGVTSMAVSDDQDSDRLLIYDAEGTLLFNSPESLGLVEDGIDAEPSEVFSLGVTLYSMIYGITPFAGTNSIQVLMSMTQEPVKFPEHRKVSKEMKQLLASMLDKNWKKRPTLTQLEKQL